MGVMTSWHPSWLPGSCTHPHPHHTTPISQHTLGQVALNLLLQLVLPLAWDGFMLRSFAPEVWAALAAARRGQRVDAAGEVVQEEEEEEEGAAATTVVDTGVLLGNVVKALGAWALLYVGVVPWENVVATLSIDPTELAMQALEGKGSGEEEGGEERGVAEAPPLPPQAPTTTRAE
jgi:hypothetical protein